MARRSVDRLGAQPECDYLDRIEPSDAQLRAYRLAALYRQEMEKRLPSAPVVSLALARQKRRPRG